MIADGEGSPALDLRIEDADTSVTVRLRGDLDMESCAVLRAAYGRVFAGPKRDVVVDLADVGFLDSSGVRVLLDGRARADELGAAFRVRQPQPLVRRVLVISGVADYVGLPPEERP
jgi:anti-sigma B factor antagonist